MTANELPRASAERVRRFRAAGLWHTRLLADGIETAAVRRPDAPALIDAERRLTYAQLARAVAAAVTTLAAQGLRPGDTAVLISGNTRHGVIAYHALLRAGATVIALDRRCGAADLRAAIDAAARRPRVIVPAAETDRLAGELAAVTTVPLEMFDGGHSVEPERPPASWTEPDRDRAAVVTFSSGTTSSPKGVVHSLNTLTAGADNMAFFSSTDESTVCFLVSPLTSVTGLMQIHLTADRHAALALEDDFAPERTLHRMNVVGATLLGGAPVIAERLLRAAEAAPDKAISLHKLALGGSMLPRPLLELATDTFGIEIVRVYGSSEAPNFSGSLPTDDRETRLSDDGALMPGGDVRVGSAAHPQEGLLYGPSVFLGYLDPEHNETAFDDGWYRTGDQVDVHECRITVVGRLKEVADRNGLKISLAEIDTALLGLPGVLECASFAMPDPATGERLAVAVQADPGASLTLGDIVAHLLAQGIAKRKLPEQLVRWDGPLPRTASGKIVRSSLVMETPAKDSDLAPRLR